jgi:regulator of replication initiation timing
VNNQTGPPVPNFNNNRADDGYKAKYKKLKAQIALLSLEKEKNQCMIAQTEGKWEYSDDSSDDDEEVRDMCFMALEDQQQQQHVAKDDVITGRWVDIILKKVCDYDNQLDPELKLDLAESLNGDLVFVETIRSDSERYLETILTELTVVRPQLNDLQSVQLALKESVLKNEALVLENQSLKSDLEKEKMIIKSWVKASGKNYDAFSKTIDAQKNAWKSGDLDMAAIIPDLHALPQALRIETPYDQPKTVKTETFETTPSEVKSGAEQAKAPVKKASDKPLPQKSKEPKTQKIKSPVEPKSKVQLPVENDFLLKLDSQLQLLSRQVQSCTARIKNLEGGSSSSVEKQKIKSPSKPKQKNVPSGTKSEQKKVSKYQKPIAFTPAPGAGVTTPDVASSSTSQQSTGSSEVKPTEPIKKRWVHKNN